LKSSARRSKSSTRVLLMAIKRPPLKRDFTNPNTVLVIFLVFFALATIIGGVMAYFGYAGQEKLKSQAKEAEKLRESANVGKNHYETMLREHRFAMGFEKEPDRRDPAELEAAKNEEKLQPMLKDIEDARSILGYDAKYQANFKDLVAKL